MFRISMLVVLAGALICPTLRAQQDDGPVIEIRAVTVPVTEPTSGTVEGTPLAPGAADKLFEGLAPLPTPRKTPFTPPPSAKPAPEPTVRVDLPLLAADDQAPAVPDMGPPTVVRMAPEGLLTSTHEAVTVSFSTPMVALTDLGSLTGAPVRLDPTPPGSWRWVSPDTLRFEHVDGLPAATAFTVTVPAGMQNAAGKTLKEPVQWRFATPKPTLMGVMPEENMELPDHPEIVLAFNQPMDPAVVAGAATLHVGGKKIRSDAVSRDDRAFGDKALMFDVPADHIVLLRFPVELGTHQPVLKLDSGLAGLQGDLRSDKQETVTYEARTPPHLAHYQYNVYQGEMVLDFDRNLSTTVDAAQFVTITPEPAHFTVRARDHQLLLGGDFQDQTTYKVTVAKGLSDAYGLTLAEAVTVEIPVSLFQGQSQRLPQSMALAESGSRELVFVTNGCPNISLKVYAVTAKDRAAFQRADSRGQPPIGRLIHSRSTVLDATQGPVRTVVALDDALIGDARLLVVAVKAEPEGRGFNSRHQQVSGYSWVQVTDLALDVAVTGDDLVLRTYDLTSGLARPGVEVRLSDGGARVVTGADGTARMPRPTTGTSLSLIAEDGGDRAVAYDLYDAPGRWIRRDDQPHGALYLVDDRGTYRPGETIHAAGWARIFEDGTPRLPKRAPASTAIDWTLIGQTGETIASGHTRTDARGVFSMTVPIPDHSPLGYTQLQVEAAGLGAATRPLHLGDVRTPTYQVAVVPSAPEALMGSESRVTVNARYYAGGVLAHAPVTWSVSAARATFQPPGWEGYGFGVQDRFIDRVSFADMTGDSTWKRSLKGRTDARGEHTLDMQWKAAPDGQAYRVHYAARIGDVDNQDGSSGASQWVHPAEIYVGLRAASGYAWVGTETSVAAITCSPSGEAVPARVHMTVHRREAYDDPDAAASPSLVDTVLESDGTQPVQISFLPKQPGRYELAAEVRDAAGRLSRTVTAVWVRGTSVDRPIETAQSLTPDKTTYAPGDTAELLLEAPFAPAEGVLLVQQGKLLMKEVFHLSSRTHVLKVPITDQMTPAAKVMVILTGEDATQVPERQSSQETLEVTLSVPPDRFALACEVVLEAEKVRPGDETELGVVVRDAAGRPVADADVVLIAADAAVGDLNHWSVDDALKTFYPDPNATLFYQGFRGNEVVSFPIMERMMRMSAAVMDDVGRSSFLRNKFSPLAAFIVDGRTDGSGRFHATVRLPDNLTRYRVTALAATDTRFGSGDAFLEASLPLMVRAATPRFLNTGDRFSLAVVVQNTTDDAMAVDVAVRAAGLTLEGAGARRITVPAQDRVRVLFPAQAGLPGEAVFQASVRGETGHDALQLTLPIYTPATTEGFAQYGTVTDGAHGLPVAVPDHAWAPFGGLSVTTSSTLLSGLTDAAAYVRDYPFLGTEQRASRILVLTALRDLAGFDPSFSAAAVDACIQEDLRGLMDLQGPDGGFAPWDTGSAGLPFLTVHVAFALQQAKAAGYAVPEMLLARVWGYLEVLNQRIPEDYDARARASITAYAAYVRRLAGKPVGDLSAVLRALPAAEHSPETLGWLLAAADGAAPTAELLRLIENRIDVTAGSARMLGAAWPGAGATLFGALRGQAVVLQALLRVQPDHALIGKLTSGLMDGRRNGRWQSTQENAQALMAMAAYLRTYEAEVPNFQAGVWLGDQLMAEASFLDRETVRQTVVIPMEQLAAYAGPLVIGKSGLGRLYYRAALSYAPADLRSKPLASGFWVVRHYEAVDDPEDVRLDADGTWYVREGARVRVITEVTVDGPRDSVALAVPLPAGLEAVRSDAPTLAPARFGRRAPGLVEEGRLTAVGVWQHHNLRAERAEAFSGRLPRGTHRFSFTARVVSPGEYLVPPARVEEMYHDETFGRTGTQRLVVTRR